MISDESYNNQLADTKAALTNWAEKNSAGARITIDQDDLYWRIAAEPYENSICPIELIFSSERKYDIAIAGASLEDQPVESFDIFLPIFDAVASGSAITRTYLTRTTHQPLATRVIVPLEDHPDWEVSTLTALGEQMGLSDSLIEDRKYARYAR